MIITPFGHMDPAAKVPAPQGGEGFLLSPRPKPGRSVSRGEKKKEPRDRFPSRGAEAGPAPSAPSSPEGMERTRKNPPAAKGPAGEVKQGRGEAQGTSSATQVPWKEEGEGAGRIRSAGSEEASSPSSDLFSTPTPGGKGSASSTLHSGDPAMVQGAALLSQAGAAPGGPSAGGPSSSVAQVGSQERTGGAPNPKGAFSKAPVGGYRSRVSPTPEISPGKGEGILKRIALFLDKEGGEAVLDLDPPSLGRLAVRMVLEGKKVELRLHAATDAVARFLEKNLAPLRHMLAEQGLSVTAFHVTSGGPDQQDPGQFARDAENRALATRRSAGSSRLSGAESEAPPPPPVRNWGSGSALDIIA